MDKILVAVGRKHTADDAWHQVICENYVRWVRKAFPDMEVIPVDYTDTSTLDEHFRDVRGIVFTGGVDINPALYQEERSSFVVDMDDDRDGFEVALFDRTYAAHIPILGICRGLQ